MSEIYSLVKYENHIQVNIFFWNNAVIYVLWTIRNVLAEAFVERSHH